MFVPASLQVNSLQVALTGNMQHPTTSKVILKVYNSFMACFLWLLDMEISGQPFPPRVFSVQGRPQDARFLSPLLLL